MGSPPPTRWSRQRANDRYKDHLNGQLTNNCLALSVTDWHTDSVTPVLETWLMWLRPLKMSAQNLLMSLMLLNWCYVTTGWRHMAGWHQLGNSFLQLSYLFGFRWLVSLNKGCYFEEEKTSNSRISCAFSNILWIGDLFGNFLSDVFDKSWFFLALVSFWLAFIRLYDTWRRAKYHVDVEKVDATTCHYKCFLGVTMPNFAL